MAEVSIKADDTEKIICAEFHRIGAFLVAVSHLRDDIIRRISEVDLIARSLAHQQIISTQERDRIVHHEDPSVTKGNVLLDVLMTKESRDAMTFLALLRETKQLSLASAIDAELKVVERIVDKNVDAELPTQYGLPIVSRAPQPRLHTQTSSSPTPDIIVTEDGMIKVYPRSAWEAENKKESSPVLRKELPYVILSHTAQIGIYNTTEECLKAVKEAQQVNFSFGFADIAYNYLVGNDGAIYEGRGLGYEGATARGWNHRSIGIAFIGEYVDTMPSPVALKALKAFLKYLKKEDFLAYDFTIHCLRQVREKFPTAPGDQLFEEIKTWRANDPESWAWRTVDDEEQANKSEGEPLSEESRKTLREHLPDLVASITNTLKLLDVLGEKGVLHRHARKKLKKESLKSDDKCDEELKKAILEHITEHGTYTVVQNLMEALVELYQTEVANIIYKYFTPEERQKFHIKQRRNRNALPYENINYNRIKFSYKLGKEMNRIHWVLGGGRYGRVVEATVEGKGNEPVAVKILNELTDKNTHEFEREARMQFQLRHSSIVTVYGMVFDKEQEYCWIVMEYMANGSLKRLLEQVVVPWPVKVRMMRDIARAMAFLHREQGELRPLTISHGDLKAANVLVDESFTVKISDFGSAVQNYVTSSTGVQHQFHKGGTLTHYAPELVRAEGKPKVNQKSDLWSFGILDFEVCAENTHGTKDFRVPFCNDTPPMKIAIDISKDEWHPLTSNNSEQMKKIPLAECPQVLIDIMFHCCKNNPDDRPKGFSDVEDLLDEAYEKQFKKKYLKSLADLILQHERLMQKKESEEEPMQLDHPESAGEMEDVLDPEAFELDNVAPWYKDTLTA